MSGRPDFALKGLGGLWEVCSWQQFNLSSQPVKRLLFPLVKKLTLHEKLLVALLARCMQSINAARTNSVDMAALRTNPARRVESYGFHIVS